MELNIIYNDEQELCVQHINKFIHEHIPNSKLLINGSAGTGKTTIIITTIFKILSHSITKNLESILDSYKNKKDYQKLLPNFIISAPTNKAKDVLLTKFDQLINQMFKNTNSDELDDMQIYKKVLKKQITFLTVSQILGINRVINEVGEEEFSRGNHSKISKKYQNKTYNNTNIIVDECSMIDQDMYNLLSHIKCPIIYIGDYCQLPPVNAILSPTFTMDADIVQITLSKVERCKNSITTIANILRNKIYNQIPEFNLLKLYIDNPINEIIIYKNQYSKWLDKYVDTIKKKQTDIKKLLLLDLSQNIFEVTQTFDTMALAWTNQCCNHINTKIRELLYIDDPLVDEHFLTLGDKIIIRNSYFKYSQKINPSIISYIGNIQPITYTPISFSTWLKTLDTSRPIHTSNLININSMFNKKSSITDYFHSPTTNETDSLQAELQNLKDLFFQHHNIQEVYTKATYEFTDIISENYHNALNTCNLHDIKKLPIPERLNKYIDWHKKVSQLIFNVPIDNINCKKCTYFIEKLKPILDTSPSVRNMILTTEKLTFDLYLCDLVIFGQKIETFKSIPIINSHIETNTEIIESIKKIIKESIDIKIKLSKQEEKELNNINEELGEDTNNDSINYITLSQLFGHYLYHVIKSIYLEVDYGYALTVHKSQGSTYHDVFMEYGNLYANKKECEKYKLLYTALTRCSNHLHLYY
jgi:hypothetical protein